MKHKARKVTFRLVIEYPLTKYGWGFLDAPLSGLLGGESGAGTGMGVRVIDWMFDTLAQLECAYSSAIAFADKYPGVKVDFMEYCDECERE